MSPDNKIYIDKNKLHHIKNKLDEINQQFDEQFNQKLKIDCKTLANAFNDIINNKLSSHKLESNIETIRGDEFNLNVISNLKEFNVRCGYDVDNIQKDLSNTIGYKTNITLEDYTYPPIHMHKLNIKIYPIIIK